MISRRLEYSRCRQLIQREMPRSGRRRWEGRIATSVDQVLSQISSVIRWLESLSVIAEVLEVCLRI